MTTDCVPSPCDIAPHPCRIVLDSNIWIDILVFDDPASRPIAAALESGRLQAVIDARCLAELTHVLDYPQFASRAIDKTEALARVARLTARIAAESMTPVVEPAIPLPKCKDRDDQKFLELAQAAGAAWLVSKDRALLKLARRTARDFGFRIGIPASLTEACGLT